jgi:hypothetical protein
MNEWLARATAQTRFVWKSKYLYEDAQKALAIIQGRGLYRVDSRVLYRLAYRDIGHAVDCFVNVMC